MSSLAKEERATLASALRRVGPDAPTLCEGWDASDLAAHIVTRDARPDAMVGKSLPFVGGKAKKAIEQIEDLDFTELVQRIEAGPPSYSPARLSPVNDLVNATEFYVHTEDVLRAQPDFDPEHPRRVSEELSKKLWNVNAETMLRAAAYKRRERITYFSPGFGAITVGRSKDPLVTVQGRPEEIVLWAFGRHEKAQVIVTVA